MKMLNEAGKTIILISHDMGVVAEYASRTIVRKGGRDIPVLLRSGGTGAVFSFKFIFKSDKNTMNKHASFGIYRAVSIFPWNILKHTLIIAFF